MDFLKKVLIVACVFSTFVGILTAFNAWSINEVSTDAYDAGKESVNTSKEYHIVGTANSIRGVNIFFCILSILFMMICIYLTYNMEKFNTFRTKYKESVLYSTTKPELKK